MDNLFVILYVILLAAVGLFILAIVLGIPIGISYFAYLWLKKKGYGRIGIFLPIGTIITVGYFIFTAFYPTESFYKDEFKEFVGLKLSNEAKIVAKKASYPDLHGDYCSAALIVLPTNEYNMILNYIKNDKNMNDSSEIGSDEYSYVFNKCSMKKFIYKISKKVKDTYFFIGFFDDNKTIVIHRSSS
jgi:hypothetical protein